MKRFWLLLLAFVLPLQMSWAAVHFCDTGMPHAAAASGSAGATQDHAQQAAEPVDAEAAKAAQVPADACCSASHGCHVLHSLVAPHEPSTGVVMPAAGLFGHDEHPAASGFPTRLERPQWSAA